MAKGDSPSNPFALALDTQRHLLDAATESVEKAQIAGDRMETIDSVEVGETPSEVVYTENKLELLHYEPQTDEQHDVPIIVAYALINKPSILDLQPDRSVVRRLLEAGHDVYLIDWNEPSRLDQHLTLDDYVNRYMDNCVDVVRERSGKDSINVLGYCMGGTMSVMYTALHQEKVRTLGLMASGLCFDETGGVLELWGDEAFYDPEDVTSAFGNMPAEMLDIGFALMDPVANYVSKYVRLYDNLENEDFVANFARMETWLSEGIDVAGETYVEFLRDIYQGNKLQRNELSLGGEHVDVTSIEVPILQITGEYDHLIPSEASKPFNDVVGSDDVETIEYPTGHIGLAVSGSSHRDVWPRVAEWYLEKSEEAEDEEGETADEAETADGDEGADEDEGGVEEVSELEELDGIGPTYASELADAGVTTRADLAAADPETVAEETGTYLDEAREWVETAGDEGADEDSQAEEAESENKSDLEVIDGIGPTYAERLREAGVTTIADLGDSDAETLAEAAEVGESRARDWIEAAQNS